MMLSSAALFITFAAFSFGNPLPFPSGEGSWLIEIDEVLAKSLTEAEIAFSLIVRNALRSLGSLQLSGIPLEDIYFVADGETSVRLSKLTLADFSGVEVNEIVPDLSLLTIYVEFSLEAVNITGDCGDYDRGNITISLTDVSVNGALGITLEDNVFRTHSADLIYTPELVSVKVFYSGNNGKLDESFTTDTVVSSLIEPFFSDLSIQLTQLVQHQINAMLEIIDINSFMNDETIASFRVYCHRLSKNLNGIADFLVDVVESDIATSYKDEVLISGFAHNFTRQVDAVLISGEFVAENGWLKSATVLRRASNVTVTRHSTAFTVFCELELRSVEFGYNRYEAKSNVDESKGEITGSVEAASFLLKVTFDLVDLECETTLNELKFAHFKTFNVVTTDVSFFSWLKLQLNSWLIGQFKQNMLPSIQIRLTDSVENALKVFHCGI